MPKGIPDSDIVVVLPRLDRNVFAVQYSTDGGPAMGPTSRIAGYAEAVDDSGITYEAVDRSGLRVGTGDLRHVARMLVDRA